MYMFGFHINKTLGSYENSFNAEINLLQNLGIKSICTQLFVTGPKSSELNITRESILAMRQISIQSTAPIIIHGSYIDNPWNKKHVAIHNIKMELGICYDMGAAGVIVHLTQAANDNLEWVLGKIIKHVNEKIRLAATLWFEIGVISESNTSIKFSLPENLKELFSRIDKFSSGNLNVGLCIDTAHLWSCGVSMRTAKLAKKWISDIVDFMKDRNGELCKNIMFHINDSAAEFGSGRDKHAALFSGNLWNGQKQGKSGLDYIIKFAMDNNIMCILETPAETLGNDLRIISEIINSHIDDD